ncbi:chromo' (CHRromatin Organization MOdifier) domain protein [Dictyocaulus viviparus]|uniref:Chromo' (CHRromatin Organization MOdifier) domain protein n=1 Tax=Dictyocaulus viviparus TaxID=29172 RepID=A0A0D8XKM2_DICVI|nr:chromo' (CHRromatin Organization MOdifier) domain protein [Dictyocaulus viviparus]
MICLFIAVMTKRKSRSAKRTGLPIGEPKSVPDNPEMVEEVYEVERIVGHRIRNGESEYKIRWYGWSKEYDEWLHYSKTAILSRDCPDAIREYWERISRRQSGAKRDHLDVENSPPEENASSAQRSTLMSTQSGCEAIIKWIMDFVTLLGKWFKNIMDIWKKPVYYKAGNRSTFNPKDCYSLSSEENSSKETLDVTNDASCTFNFHIPASSAKNKITLNTYQKSCSILECKQSPNDKTIFALSSNVHCSDKMLMHPFPPSSSCVSSPVVRRKVIRPPPLPKRKTQSSSMASNNASPVVAANPTVGETPTSERIVNSVNNHASGASGSLNCKDQEAMEVDADTSIVNNSTEDITKAIKPSLQKKPFVTPHGFERGLTVERIHGFIKRADLIFAIVEFKNCNIIEFLSTKILQHYDPLALIRGFEEHYVRFRQKQKLQQSSPIFSP